MTAAVRMATASRCLSPRQVCSAPTSQRFASFRPPRSVGNIRSFTLHSNPALSVLALHSSAAVTRPGLYRSCRPLGPSTLQRRQYGSSFLGIGGSSSVMTVYWIMLGLNSVPFALWLYADSTSNLRLQSWWQKNMLVSAASVEAGRWWTVVTSAFAHAAPVHFAFNMFTANTFCQILSMTPGMTGGHAAVTILGSAVCGSLGFLVNQRYNSMAASRQGRTRDAYDAYHARALGASGAVMGLGAVATCFAPFLSMNVMFIPIAIPLWAVTCAYLAIDAFGLNSARSTVAHAGHLGGLAFGTLYYLVSLKSLAPLGIWAMFKRFIR